MKSSSKSKTCSNRDKSSNDERYSKKNSRYRGRKSSSDRNSARNAENDARNVRADGSFDTLKGVNDISWYTRYPILSSTAASFPYPYRPGMEFDLGSAAINIDGTVQDGIRMRTRIPGVLRINWSPSVGYSTEPTDPASNVGKEIYARVRAVYSGSLDADAPDFIMYLMALDSIFAYLAWLKRVYRTTSAWSPDNYTTPDWLLRAYGFTVAQISDLRQNKTQLLNRINELILQTGKFKCPAVMDVFNRHFWMSDNVYTDSQYFSTSQLYVFNPTGFYTLNPTAAIPGDSTNTAAGLTYTELKVTTPTQGSVVESLYAYGLAMIKALDEWDDGYTISGYLKRAYDGIPSFVVAPLDASEMLEPIYVEEVLTQIENCRGMINYTSYVDNCRNVYQNPLTNAVISQPMMFIPQGSAKGDEVFLPGIISVRSPNPSPADNIIATRLQTVVTPKTETHLITNSNGYAVTCGTELVDGLSLIQWNYTETTASNQGLHITPLRQFFHIEETSSTAVADVSEVSFLSWIQDLAQFDWHPFCYLLFQEYNRNNSAANNYGFTLRVIGDTHNITQVEWQNMQLLHRVCLFSEFNAFSQQ